MTTQQNDLCDVYRQADLTDRLHMYLQFPELRNDFLVIDQQALQTGCCATAARTGKCSRLWEKMVCLNLSSLFGGRRSSPDHG